MKTKYLVLFTALITLNLTACGSKNKASNAAIGPVNPFGISGCVPLGQPLSFAVQGGASVNDIVILAGNIPQGRSRAGQYGQVMMGTTTGQAFGGLTKSGQNGSISMGLQTNYQYNPFYSFTSVPGAPAAITGTIQLAPQIVSILQSITGYYGSSTFGQVSTSYMPNNNGFYGQAGCITSVGIEAVWTPNFNTVNQVLLHLYMNNGSAPTPIIL